MVFKTLEQYQAVRDEERGTKLHAAMEAIKYILSTPCASIPKLGKDGNLLPADQQPAPYSEIPPLTPPKILVYHKFTQNFPMILSVSQSFFICR